MVQRTIYGFATALLASGTTAMVWNYRVMRHKSDADGHGEMLYAIHEVFYDETGKVTTWTQDPCGSPMGETPEEMSRDLVQILAAISEPILDAANGAQVEPAAMTANALSELLRRQDARSTPLR